MDDIPERLGHSVAEQGEHRGRIWLRKLCVVFERHLRRGQLTADEDPGDIQEGLREVPEADMRCGEGEC